MLTPEGLLKQWVKMPNMLLQTHVLVGERPSGQCQKGRVLQGAIKGALRCGALVVQCWDRGQNGPDASPKTPVVD